MARLLFVGTYGPENPTKSALPFVWANSAKDAGHDAEVFLFGDSVVVMKDVIAANITPVGWPGLRDILAEASNSDVRTYV